MKTKRQTSSAFWDTSAIVPLCCQQELSQQMRKQWRETARVIVWWGTTVEVRSAIGRLHSEAKINNREQKQALARLEVLRQEWREITPSEKLRALAETIPERYGLRAMDSFQLAAALIWCDDKPGNRTFVCDDAKLSEAAQTVGFSLKP